MHGQAVFLDRDGTLIEDRGYLRSIEEVVFIQDVFQSLRKLTSFYELFLVTNQSGISKGITTEEEVEAVNQYVSDCLLNEGVALTEVYSCPHEVVDGCACRKPNSHFAELAASRYHLDLSRCWAVGDHPHDVLFAENFGGRGIYVLTGHGVQHRKELPAGTRVCRNCPEAVDLILSSAG